MYILTEVMNDYDFKCVLIAVLTIMSAIRWHQKLFGHLDHTDNVWVSDIVLDNNISRANLI